VHDISSTNLKILTSILIALVVSSCATTARERALTVAKSGESATKTLNKELSALSKSVTDLDLYDAFLETYDLCIKKEEDCELRTGNQTNLERRRTYSKHVAARTKALKDLSAVYVALRKDAENDDRAEIAKSVGKLGGSINSYLEVLNVDVIGEAIIAPVKFATGIIASANQKKRLDVANSELAIASATLNRALVVEHKYSDSVFDYVSAKTTPFETILTQSGLISYRKILEPLAQSKSIELVEDAEVVIRDDVKLKRSVEAIAAARTPNRSKQIKNAYVKSAEAFQKMSDVHSAYDKADRSLDDIIRLWGEVETAVDLIENLVDGADDNENPKIEEGEGT